MDGPGRRRGDHGPFAGDEDAVTQFVRLIAQAYRDGGLPTRVPFPTVATTQESSR